MDLDELREAIRAGSFQWRKHILVRLAERSIPQRMIIETIMKGEIVEDYPHNNPFPSCLMLGWVEGTAYHVVVSFDDKSKMGYIITTYQPSMDRFEPDFRTRRQ